MQFGEIIEYPLGESGEVAPALVLGVNEDGTANVRVFSTRAGTNDAYLSNVDFGGDAPTSTTDTSSTDTSSTDAGDQAVAADQADNGTAHPGRALADPFAVQA